MLGSFLFVLFLTFDCHGLALDETQAVRPPVPPPQSNRQTRNRVITWHAIQFPNKSSPHLREHEKTPEVEGLGDNDDDTSNTEEDVLLCGPECNGYVNETVTAVKAESDFAYEEFSDDGGDKEVHVDLDGAFLRYLNGWREGERWLKSHRELTGSPRRRRRDVVLGDDTRFTITDREWLNQIPFSPNVRISTGCSGILISEQHVLTAASCVHNGRKMIDKMRDFEIGIRQKRQLSREEELGKNWREAFRWFPLKKIYVPKEWSSRPPKGKKGRMELPMEKNYAVIRLKRKVDRDFLEVSVGSVANVGEGKRIHFSSFDETERPTLNYRFCEVMEETMEIIYQQCDGTSQSVGAGVYVRKWNNTTRNWDRKVIGVFTGHQLLYLEDGTVRERNIAVKITPLKFAQICFWMTGDYGQCRG